MVVASFPAGLLSSSEGSGSEAVAARARRSIAVLRELEEPQALCVSVFLCDATCAHSRLGAASLRVNLSGLTGAETTESG